MKINVFYSWQSDSDFKLNKFFIKDCIQSAIRKITQNKLSGDGIALEIRVDHDTKGKSGTPNIVQTIFEKIDQANIFIADISFSGKITVTKKDELMPNSNVLFEMGYAAGKIGWDKIVTVSNTNFGSPDKLPFDLKQRRWPITYCLSPSETSEEKLKIKQRLIEALVYAISQPIESGVVYQSIDPKDERVAKEIVQLTNQFPIFFHSFMQDNAELQKYRALFIKRGLSEKEMTEFSSWLTESIALKGLLGESNVTQFDRKLNWLGALVLYLRELDQRCDKILDRYSFAEDELVDSLHALQKRAQTQINMFNITMSVDPSVYSGKDTFPKQHLEFVKHLILEIIKSRNKALNYLSPNTEI